MKRVILTPNPYRDGEFRTVRAAEQILRSAGLETRICLPFEIDKSFPLPRDIRFSRLDREIGNADALVCFGGDGTILHIAKTATRHRLPVLGVNIGTMGFIAELESTELSELKRLATGNYKLDCRMMLDVTIRRDKDVIFHDIALNDITFGKANMSRIVHLSVRCDGAEAMNFGGDGLIIATPTGSTAYNLSAGGSIVEPDARAILVTPICPHDITTRSIVTSDRRTITVQLPNTARRNAYLSVDGGRSVRLAMGDVATITCSKMETKLIRMKNRSFYDIMNTKFRHID